MRKYYTCPKCHKKTADYLGNCLNCEEKRLRRIRQRRTYKDFEEYLCFFEKPRTREEILRYIHSIIDGRKGYGYMRNSLYAEESLKQLLEDKREEVGKIGEAVLKPNEKEIQRKP